jgi:2-polyprenyl-6-methoxyphenol hydroxylase-like FAD-dependent oxidoreductase
MIPEHSSSNSGPTALVVGAGVGGLAAALGLRQAGFAVEMVERGDELRTDGAGLSLWPNALSALDALGVGMEVREAGQPQEGGALRGQNGGVLSAIDPHALADRFGETTIMIERPILHEVLQRAAGDTTIHLGAEVVAVEPGSPVTIRIRDGRRHSADLVVAADGVASTIRSALFDSTPPKPSRLIAWRGVADKVDRQLEARLTPGECWARGELFGMVPLKGGRVYWWAAGRSAADETGSRDAELASLLDRMSNWPDPAETLVRRTPNEAIVRTPLFEGRAPRAMVKNRVALLGDAAHPMLPHLGQGGCQAFEDAAVLAACARETSDLDVVLSRYERRRLKRSASIVRRSTGVARVAHLRGPFAAARNLALRLAPPSLSLRQLDPVVGWRLDSDAL